MGDYSFIQEDVIRGYYPFFSVLFGVEVSYINAFFSELAQNSIGSSLNFFDIDRSRGWSSVSLDLLFELVGLDDREPKSLSVSLRVEV